MGSTLSWLDSSSLPKSLFASTMRMSSANASWLCGFLPVVYVGGTFALAERRLELSVIGFAVCVSDHTVPLRVQGFFALALAMRAVRAVWHGTCLEIRDTVPVPSFPGQLCASENDLEVFHDFLTNHPFCNLYSAAFSE